MVAEFFWGERGREILLFVFFFKCAKSLKKSLADFFLLKSIFSPLSLFFHRSQTNSSFLTFVSVSVLQFSMRDNQGDNKVSSYDIASVQQNTRFQKQISLLGALILVLLSSPSAIFEKANPHSPYHIALVWSQKCSGESLVSSSNSNLDESSDLVRGGYTTLPTNWLVSLSTIEYPAKTADDAGPHTPNYN